MKMRIINKSKHKLPEYTTEHSAGMDLRAKIDEDIVLEPMKRALVKTRLFMEVPEGYEAQIGPRSDLAINRGITVLNSPGTIDADYRGEVWIILINLSDQNFVVKDGERIYQMIISKHERAEWVVVDELIKTNRG
jgi:dUTP pyrophosphatase